MTAIENHRRRRLWVRDRKSKESKTNGRLCGCGCAQKKTSIWWSGVTITQIGTITPINSVLSFSHLISQQQQQQPRFNLPRAADSICMFASALLLRTQCLRLSTMCRRLHYHHHLVCPVNKKSKTTTTTTATQVKRNHVWTKSNRSFSSS